MVSEGSKTLVFCVNYFTHRLLKMCEGLCDNSDWNLSSMIFDYLKKFGKFSLLVVSSWLLGRNLKFCQIFLHYRYMVELPRNITCFEKNPQTPFITTTLNQPLSVFEFKDQVFTGEMYDNFCVAMSHFCGELFFYLVPGVECQLSFYEITLIQCIQSYLMQSPFFKYCIHSA